MGAFEGYSGLVQRQGIEVNVDSHSDYFANDKQAIRCQMRSGPAVYRPSVFTKVTGLAAQRRRQRREA